MTSFYGSGSYASPFGESFVAKPFPNQPFPHTVFNPPENTKFGSQSKKTKFPFPIVGTDLLTGQRNVDILEKLQNPEVSSSGTEMPYSGSALPDVDPKLLQYWQLTQAMRPGAIADYEKMSEIASQQQLRQAEQLYPLLSKAGQEATARSLAASQAYRAFAESMPSNIQSIMASKQAQGLTAASAEAERARAIAAQQDAAVRFASIAPYYSGGRGMA